MESIYNSRNYYRLLNQLLGEETTKIYNSRNYYRLLNIARNPLHHLSTTVEITIGYLTVFVFGVLSASTTVEITIGYLTSGAGGNNGLSTTVEITIGYLTSDL